MKKYLIKIKNVFILFTLIISVLFTVNGCTVSVNQNTDNITTTSSDTSSHSGELVVHFVDVGQGDCEFIEFPNGENMIIDSGEYEYAATVVNYISSLGYDSLNYVVVSHPHTDHMGAMSAIIDEFDADEIYMPKVSATTSAYEDLLETISQNGLYVNTAKAGVEFSVGDVKLEFLSPISDEYDDLNNYSAVLKVTYDNCSFLFTGDAESTLENEIVESGADIDVDVLKVCHHGSKYSSTSAFLDAVSPDYAVIEVGGGNTYGHPHNETMNELMKREIEIYRTDLCGNIIFTCDGNDYQVTFNNELQSVVTTNDITVTTASSTDENTEENSTDSTTESSSLQENTTQEGDYTYCLNVNSKKIHTLNCSSLKSTKEENKQYTTKTLEELEELGYTPCSRCIGK